MLIFLPINVGSGAVVVSPTRQVDQSIWLSVNVVALVLTSCTGKVLLSKSIFLPGLAHYSQVPGPSLSSLP